MTRRPSVSACACWEIGTLSCENGCTSLSRVQNEHRLGIGRASATHASLRFSAGLALTVGDHCPGHTRALRSGARLPARAYQCCTPCFCSAFLRRIAQNSAVTSTPQRSSMPAPSCTPGRLRTSHWPCLCSASLLRCLPTLLCTPADSAESCMSPALGVLTTPCSLDCAGAFSEWEGCQTQCSRRSSRMLPPDAPSLVTDCSRPTSCFGATHCTRQYKALCVGLDAEIGSAGGGSSSGGGGGGTRMSLAPSRLPSGTPSAGTGAALAVRRTSGVRRATSHHRQMETTTKNKEAF